MKRFKWLKSIFCLIREVSAVKQLGASRFVVLLQASIIMQYFQDNIIANIENVWFCFNRCFPTYLTSWEARSVDGKTTHSGLLWTTVTVNCATCRAEDSNQFKWIQCHQFSGSKHSCDKIMNQAFIHYFTPPCKNG